MTDTTEAVRLADDDTDPLYQRLMGRIEYLLKIKRVKDPELMMTTVEVLTDIADAAKGLAEIASEMDNGTNPGLGLCCLRIEAAITKIYGEQQ